MFAASAMSRRNPGKLTGAIIAPPGTPRLIGHFNLRLLHRHSGVWQRKGGDIMREGMAM